MSRRLLQKAMGKLLPLVLANPILQKQIFSTAISHFGGRMELQEAQRSVLDSWLSIVEKAFECNAKIDESLTEEFEWGWVVYFVPIDPNACKLLYKRYRFACDRTNGNSLPVGTAGLRPVLEHLMEF